MTLMYKATHQLLTLDIHVYIFLVNMPTATIQNHQYILVTDTASLERTTTDTCTHSTQIQCHYGMDYHRTLLRFQHSSSSKAGLATYTILSNQL